MNEKQPVKLTSALLLTCGLAAGADILSFNQANAAAGAAAAGLNAPAAAKNDTKTPPVIRGWQIDSVSAIKRGVVTEVVPQYEERKLVRTAKQARSARQGTFMILEVRCSWATPQPPDQPLWIGKPDVTLVDDQGVEYPAVDTLLRKSGEYITPGMVDHLSRKDFGTVPAKKMRLLVYFDVPDLAGNCFLKFPSDGPVVAVNKVNDLPDPATDLPN